MRTSATQNTPNPGRVNPDYHEAGKQSQTLCYTSRAMPRCPLCSVRSAKRFCPAKETTICPVCCGTKREIEIDCPSSCPHLKAGRSYEAEKRIPDADFAARIQSFDQDFLRRYSPVLDGLTRTVVEERLESPWLVDHDLVEVYKALSATMKTLSSGIYYETVPDGPVRGSLFRRLKAALDNFMQPDLQGQQSVLKVSESLQILEFLTLAATANSGTRPKSRQYLDWLTSVSGVPGSTEQSTPLIVP